MSYEESEQSIQSFADTANGPEQLTDKWYEIRNEQLLPGVTRIGGSEIAALLGENPYQSKADTIAYKSGKQERKMGGMMACWFGTMFEEAAIKVFEYMQRTKVHCKNISLIDKAIVGFMYSPDGIISLPHDKEGNLLINKDVTIENYDVPEDVVYQPTLVEIKCPYKRLPNQMPSYYYSQLQSGFMNIDIINSAIFIDNLFRICSKECMDDTSTYSVRLFQCSRFTRDTPLLFGYIMMYENGVDHEEMTDLGTLNNDKFEGIMEDVVTGIKYDRYRIDYSNIYDDPDECKKYMKKDVIKDMPKYLMCWKLLDIKYTKIYPDEFQIEKIRRVVTQYVNGELS